MDYRMMGSLQDEPRGSGHDRSLDRSAALASLPLPVAVVCCVLNFLVPGFGTIVSGFASLCCGRLDDTRCSVRCAVCSASIIIGLLQMVLTVLFLFGWIWSCIWGVMFIGTAYKGQQFQDVGLDMEDISSVTGSTVYMNQPSINIHIHNISPEIIPVPPNYDDLDHSSFSTGSLLDLHSEPTSDADEQPPPYIPP